MPPAFARGRDAAEAQLRHRVRVQVGRQLLKQCCFIHLDDDGDKFLLLMEMLHKLYALVNLQCCEDNPDTLTHHEILLPGQLLVKLFKEKVEEAMTGMVEQVRCRLAA
jgi:DNA-directed RNA polymerase beta subunit